MKKKMQIKEELLDIDGIKGSNKSLIDLFIRRTAVLTSTPEWMVEKIIKDQWKTANKNTQPGYDISEFDFPNLGTFFISPSKSRKRLVRMNKYKDELEKLSPDMDEKAEKKRLHRINQAGEVINSIKQKTKQLSND